jgi:hypothetical protein
MDFNKNILDELQNNTCEYIFEDPSVLSFQMLFKFISHGESQSIL